MKRLLLGISLLIYTITGVYAQTAISPRVAIGSFNPSYGNPYIRTITPISEGGFIIRTPDQQANLGGRFGIVLDSISDEFQYFDGLGRPLQTIQRAVTPNRDDLIIHHEYDAMGRENKLWLPSVGLRNYGALVQVDKFRQKAFDTYQDSAYSRPVYEASPLNRIIEQYGPGQKWYGNKKFIKTEYLTNRTTGELSCIRFSVDGEGLNTTLVQNKNYNDAELFVTKTTSEEGSISYEFKDKLGQVLLTRQINNNAEPFDTYYIYDIFGNKCFVLPPILSKKASENKLSTEELDLYAYQYKYDHRKRCTLKKLPGASPVRYIYDKADRLIFTQDGEQYKKREWMFSIYDALGRSVLTGICKNTDIANEKYQNLIIEAEAKDEGTYRGYNLLVNGEKTSLDSVKLLTVNYYDNYNFLGTYTPNWQFTVKDGYGVRFTGANKGYETKGLLTGTSVALLDGSDKFLHSVSYYDNRARVVQTIVNNHIGGEDKTWFAYSYADWVTKQMHEHTAKIDNISTRQTELYSFSYDHAGRLIKTDYKLNDLPQIVLVENKYNNLGQLEYTGPINVTDLKTSYTYNVRSWTDSIANNHFKQKLDYDFSGNIEYMTWYQDKNKRSYTFEYDKISRLTKALYTGAKNEDFSTSYMYDSHGNIQFLKRNGIKDDQKPGLIDDLEFKYTGNQMKSVKDLADPVMASASVDVRNYADKDIEFLYNANGAMTQDLNKGIQDIAYNYLNLPKELIIDNDNVKAKNTYTYSATGGKLRVVHESSPQEKIQPLTGIMVSEDYSEKITTDYVGNMIYEDGGLKRILLSNGYYDNTDKKFYFYIKDHLGNNRIVADASGTVIQSNQYYPFGMAFAESTTAEQSSQPYKYNGKELDETHGLNWYDYSARFYDAGYITLPTIDPLSEKYYSISPYVYVANNPMKYIDPTGMWISTDVEKNKNGTYSVVGGKLDGDLNIYVTEEGKRTGEIVGKTITETSFYYSDGDEWLGTINPKDGSGQRFLNDFKNSDTEITYYMNNAKTNQRYDFKATNGKDTPLYSDKKDHYRGMPLGKTKDGVTIYSSARDVGNIAAGYIAGRYGIPWEIARKEFDKLESKQKGGVATEGISTQNAQRNGWISGYKDFYNNPLKGIGTRWSRSAPGAIMRIFKK